MKSCHYFNSTVSLESLAIIWKHFSILNEYVSHAPAHGQRPYHTCPKGFNISIDALVAGLRFPLHPAREQLADSEDQPWYVRTRGRQMEDELLRLTHAIEALRVDLPKQAIEDYKKLPRFEMGLVQMGQLSFEYGYQVALARLQAWYPDLEIEEDPFKILPKDLNVLMATEQSLDDSPSPPEE
ncbi:hypothetical protein BHM03_00045268 [Ensete ventricosum]|nr:hypothetical protein BHM03_00045268 [Ensete ventricosum]